MFLKYIFINATILHYACKSGNRELVRYLISLKKIDANTLTVFYSEYLI